MERSQPPTVSVAQRALFGSVGGGLSAGGVALLTGALAHANRSLVGALCVIALLSGGVAILVRARTAEAAGWIGAAAGLAAALTLLLWAISKI